MKQAAVSLAPTGAGAVAGTASGAVIIYKGALAGGTADLRYTVNNSGVKEDIILNRYRTNAFTFRLTLEGLRPEIGRNGNLLLYNAANAAVAYAGKPYAYDAGKKKTRQAGFTLAREGTAYLLTITVDQKWLQAPDRLYPVTIDPYWVFLRGAFQDTFLDENTEGWHPNEDLYAGYDSSPGGYGRTRSLAQFDLASIPAEQRIIGGEYWMKISPNNGNNNNFEGKAYRLRQSWQEQWATWTYADGSWTQWGPLGGPATPGGYFWVPEDSDRIPKSFNNTANPNRVVWWVTDMVREWYADPNTNYGLIVTANLESSDPVKRYYSTETGPGSNDWPTLWVMYEAGFNGLQDYWTYINFPLGDGQVAKVNVAGGNLVLQRRDWSLPSVGIDTVIDRIYLLNEATAHDFGYNWMMSLHPELTAFPTAPPRPQIFLDPAGTRYIFEPKPESDGTHQGKYFRARGIKAELELVGSEYRVKYDNGLTFKFNSSDYRLQNVADRNGNTIGFHYDANGKIDQVTDTVGRTITITRDASGNISQIADILGRTTSYTDTTFTNQRNKTTVYSYSDTRLGIRDPKNQSAPNDTAEVTFESVGAAKRVTTFSYIKPNGGKDTYTFSYPAARTTKVTNPRGASYYTTYSWDAKSGAVKTTTDALGKTVTTNYGANWNIDDLTDQQGGTTDFHYYDYRDINLEWIKDASNVQTKYFYTDLNNPYYPTRVTDPQGNNTDYFYDPNNGNLTAVEFTVDGGNKSTANYWYNPNGALSSFRDPRLKTTNYSYIDPATGSADIYGRLRKITNPLGHEIKMEYDAAGRLTRKTDAKLQNTDYSYDNQDNITKIWYHNGMFTEFAYDDNGNLYQTWAGGVGGETPTTFTYDYRNQLTTKAPPYWGTLVFGYDAAGNLISKDDGAGAVTQYEYNDYRNILTGIRAPGGALTSLTYNDDYTIARMTYPTTTAVTVDYTYTNANRLQKIVNSRGATVLSSFEYSYQKSGLETALRYSVTDKDGAITAYDYDEMNHLKQANSPGKNRSWQYDANGNRTQQTINGVVTNYVYDDASRMTGAGSVSYTYDNNGNMTTRSSPYLSIPYDEADRSFANYMAYTGRDQTQRKRNADTWYVYDGSSPGPLAEQDGAAPVKHYITTPTGGLVGLYFNGAMYYYLFDGTGSVVGLVDSAGNQVNTYAYEPFGEFSSAPVEGVVQPYKFHGGYFDSVEGFYKMGARYYEPETGRFTQPEPAWSNPMFNTMGGRNLLTERRFGTGATTGQEVIPLPGGYYRPAVDYNWYSYAGNDPIVFLDVSGYQRWREQLGWALVLVALEIPTGIGVAVAIVQPELAIPVAKGIEIYHVFILPLEAYAVYRIATAKD